jgi:hypothetical protein
MLVAVALAARSSHAAELRSDVETSAKWNSNAPGAGEGSDEGERSDVLLGFGSRFNLTSDPDRFSWRLGYAPLYERFIDLSELDNWRHRGWGSFRYGLTRATQLGGAADFSRSTRTNPDAIDEVAPPTEPTLEETDEEIDRASMDLTLSHTFGPRWTGNAAAGYSFTNYAREDRSDFEGANASAGLNYAMSARQSLGGGVSVSRQVVKQADVEVAGQDFSTDSEQETRFASLFGSWAYQLTPLWRLNLRAGPTLIDAELQDTAPVPISRVPIFSVQTAPGVVRLPLDARRCDTLPCPVDPNGFPPVLLFPLPADFQNPEVVVDTGDLVSQGNSTTIFANFGIVRSGERSQFTLNYSRSAGENFGGRTSTVSDVLSSRLSWQPDADWRFDFRASYSKQQQATSAEVIEGLRVVRNAGTVPGLPPNAAILELGPDGTARVVTREVDDAFDVDSWTLSVRATRRLTRRLSGFLGVRYLDQTNNGFRRSVVDDLDQFEAGFGLTYAFDPLRL